MELKNDLAITGTLHSVDQYLNIKLNNIRVGALLLELRRQLCWADAVTQPLAVPTAGLPTWPAMGACLCLHFRPPPPPPPTAPPGPICSAGGGRAQVPAHAVCARLLCARVCRALRAGRRLRSALRPRQKSVRCQWCRACLPLAPPTATRTWSPQPTHSCLVPCLQSSRTPACLAWLPLPLAPRSCPRALLTWSCCTTQRGERRAAGDRQALAYCH